MSANVKTGFPRRQWVDMTTEEFAAITPDTIAVLPVAAIEQHGPHLPVYVDACINAGVIERTLKLLPDDLPVTFLPAQNIGKSNEHQAFPGTLTLSAETLIRLWTEIAESVHRAGIRKLVLFNSHGGQPQVQDIVARDLRVRLDMFVVTAATWSFGSVPDMYPAKEKEHGIHGGSSETSMMLALRPDLVHRDKAKNFEPLTVSLVEEYRYLNAEGKVGFGWQTQDMNMDGACGNALDADAERGNRSLDHAAQGFVTLLQEIHRYPLARVRSRS